MALLFFRGETTVPRIPLKERDVFVGYPMYLCGQGHEPEYHDMVGVVALNDKEVEQFVIDYCMERNPKTSREIWRVERIKKLNVREIGISLVKAMRLLKNIGVLIIDH